MISKAAQEDRRNGIYLNHEIRLLGPYLSRPSSDPSQTRQGSGLSIVGVWDIAVDISLPQTEGLKNPNL